MMDQDRALERIVEEIADVGELTRVVAQRYDAIFSAFDAILAETLEQTSSMADAARLAIALADGAVDSMRENFVGQPKFDCQKSCSACCHLYVAVPPGISELISAHIDATFTPTDRALLISRLEEAAAKAATSATPQTLRSRCPLLDDEDKCSVYDVRPISCRSFTSTSRVRCEQVVFGAPSGSGGVDQNPARYRLYESATKALQKAALRRGLPSKQLGLSGALLAQLAR